MPRYPFDREKGSTYSSLADTRLICAHMNTPATTTLRFLFEGGHSGLPDAIVGRPSANRHAGGEHGPQDRKAVHRGGGRVTGIPQGQSLINPWVVLVDRPTYE